MLLNQVPSLQHHSSVENDPRLETPTGAAVTGKTLTLMLGAPIAPLAALAAAIRVVASSIVLIAIGGADGAGKISNKVA